MGDSMNIQKLTYTKTPEELKGQEGKKVYNTDAKAAQLSYTANTDETELVALSLEEDDTVEEADSEEDTVQETKAVAQEEKEEQKFMEVKVVAWGSAPEDGKKYANDCLSRIMANAYPDIKLYSEEWNKLEEEIMNLNPEIYGKLNEDGTISDGRKRLIDNTRHNSVLLTDDVIKLPVLEKAEAKTQSDEVEDEGETKPEETGDETDGTKVETTTHDDGSYTTKTITPEGNKYGVTSESIEYDADGKALSGTAEYTNGVVANIEFKYNEDNSYDKIYTPTEETASMTDTALYCQQFDSTGKLTKEIWEINDTTDGGKIYSERVQTGENTYTTTMINDDLKVVIDSVLDENNREMERTEKFYDEQGNPELGKITNFEYREDGKPSKITTQFFDKTGLNWSTSVTEYNDDDSYTETKVYPESDNITWEWESFDVNHKIKEGKYIRKGTSQTGEIRGVIIYNADGGKTVTEYAMKTGDMIIVEFDKNGHETKRDFIKGPEVMTI